MKKIILFLLVIGGSTKVMAQELGYGVLLGFNAYDVEIDGPISASSGDSGMNIGGFADYQLNSSFGVRGNLMYTSVEESHYTIEEGGSVYYTFSAFNLKTLQLHALARYDVNKEYNKGFYITGGLRMTNILSAKGDGEQINDFYKKVNLGAMLGFGVNFAKHFGIEFIPEVNVTNTLDSKENKARNYGFYANLTVNVESLLRK